MATAAPFPVLRSTRTRGSTLTRLGAALAACAVRAEQRKCQAELLGFELRTAETPPEFPRQDGDKHVLE
jgi:hypothetical protein